MPEREDVYERPAICPPVIRSIIGWVQRGKVEGAKTDAEIATLVGVTSYVVGIVRREAESAAYRRRKFAKSRTAARRPWLPFHAGADGDKPGIGECPARPGERCPDCGAALVVSPCRECRVALSIVLGRMPL